MSNNPPKSFLDLYDEETANNSSNSSNSKKKPSKFKRDPMGFDIGVGGSNFLKDPLAGYLNGTSSGTDNNHSSTDKDETATESDDNRITRGDKARSNDEDDDAEGSAENEEDVDDCDNWASAPPVDYLDSVKGYELVTFDAASVPPPPPPPPVLPPPSEPPPEIAEDGQQQHHHHRRRSSAKAREAQESAYRVITLESDHAPASDVTAKESLLSHIDERCCYGTGAAKGMTIKKLDYQPAYHYELQTFTEKRETAWTYAPVKQYFIENNHGGPPPLPWDIEEEPTQFFKDEVRLIAVPNTSSIKTCQRCRGTGGVTCRDCNGKGWSRCMHCHGDGYMGHGGGGEHGSMKERCFYCHHSKHGHGQMDCSKCHTKGKVDCASCEGGGQVRCYIQLSITWKVHTAEHIVEDKFKMPGDLIRDVSGQVAFEEEAPNVKPLEALDQEGISTASRTIVAEHLTAFAADQRVVRQRHQVRIVPVTKVFYEWKNKEYEYFCYGYENKVHLKIYPQNCCWGCILV